MAEDKTRGPIDLNNADFETIAKLPMVGEKRAHFIVDNRPYQSWDDLRKVPGLSDGMVEDLRNSNATLGKK
ncbi:MAG TPA: helix-hairpin-helix domain-containing protein [Chitinispirillaceae bacterium]|nr:helix-hairpin-helix domain-containing protein [Chitinispirillaceae bacterium]